MQRQLPLQACVWGRIVHKQESLEQLFSDLRVGGALVQGFHYGGYLSCWLGQEVQY